MRDCTEPATWWPHVDEAVRTLSRGALVVLPTDTVYGVAADAFTPEAVAALLAAKGRDRQMPPPVLIGDVRTLDGLATQVPDVVRDLVARFWPGALTVILPAQPSLMWDLGETEGTVALRMPDQEFTLALLRKTGPLAVSSANVTGRPAALTAPEAADQLGNSVSLYLDGGPAAGETPSTIVDATGERLRIVRAGAITAEELAHVAPELAPEAEPPAEDAGEDAGDAADESPGGGGGEGADDSAVESAEGAAQAPAQDPARPPAQEPARTPAHNPARTSAEGLGEISADDRALPREH